MGFVKLDCGILDSTLWSDRNAREIFITCLLMAEPIELREQMATVDCDGFVVPVGWYGMVQAAGPGIARRAGLPMDDGLEALKRLSDVDTCSRTPLYDGRRVVRVDGGFIILNFDKYRQKDHTAAERSRRWRERHKKRVSNVTQRVSSRSVTQAEAEAEAEAEAHTDSACSVELPKGFPKTEAEAVASIGPIGCPAEFAATTYQLALGRGGRDSRDVPIRTWSGHLRSSWVFQQNRNEREKINDKHRSNYQQRPNRNIGTANETVDHEAYGRLVGETPRT